MSAIETAERTKLDETIEQVEMLYKALTGKEPGPAEAIHAPIPAEKDPSVHVESQVDRLLGLLGRVEPGAAAPPWTPPMSVWESEREVLVCLDLPGVDRESVTVQVQGNVLVVSGKRNAPPADGWRLCLNERPLGDFRRSVVVAAARGADPAARMRDGVLEIRVAKEVVQAPEVKTIPVG